jgi:histidyl-tRNA synthetase
MQVPYSINNCLVGGKDYYTRTIFEIRTDDAVNKAHPKEKFENVLAAGARYDDLAKRLGSKRDVPSVGISISLGGLGLVEPRKRAEQKKSRKPPIYLIHIGMSAKQQSLEALEILRKAKIPVYQSLSRDKISVQVAAAEKMNVPYTIIIGQKEALEGTAIVRNMQNRSQQTVPLAILPSHLKKVW